MDDSRITVLGLEHKIFEMEHIVVAIRLPLETLVRDWPFERQAADKILLKNWLEDRIKPLLAPGVKIVVFDPRCFKPNIAVCTLGNLRRAYGNGLDAS